MTEQKKEQRRCLREKQTDGKSQKQRPDKFYID